MWLIGIRSSIITLLALLAYTLLVEVLNLKDSILGHLEHIVFGLGIYSSHFYYKNANNGCISYIEGLQVGMVSVLFTSLAISFLTYIMYVLYDNYFLHALLSELKGIFQQINSSSSFTQDKIGFIESLYASKVLIIIIFLSISFTGFIFTSFIAFFVRKNSSQ